MKEKLKEIFKDVWLYEMTDNDYDYLVKTYPDIDEFIRSYYLQERYVKSVSGETKFTKYE
jgi:hypothetical protein